MARYSFRLVFDKHFVAGPLVGLAAKGEHIGFATASARNVGLAAFARIAALGSVIEPSAGESAYKIANVRAEDIA